MSDEKGASAPPQYSAVPQEQLYPVVNQPGQTMGQTTTVVIQPGQVSGSRDWSSPLCSCFDDMTSCLCTTFFQCCYVGCLYQRYQETWCTVCCVPMADMFLRVQHRNRHRIAGSVNNDCMMMTFCGPCSVCQVKRDMDYVERMGGKLAF